MRQILLFLLSLIINLVLIDAFWGSVAFGDNLSPVIEKRPLVRQNVKETDYFKLIAKLGINFHWKVVSPIYGDRCRMEPSCSRYSYQAYEKYGFLKGTILTFDRLLHEGDEHTVSHIVYSRGKKRFVTYDPLENNIYLLNRIFKKGGG